METLRQELVLLEKILENTERQGRFLATEHKSLKGLTRLLAKRRQLLERLSELKAAGCRKASGDEVLQQQIRNLWYKLKEADILLHRAALAEKNRISQNLVGNKVARNVRNAYIMRWYQGVSRGFDCQG